MEKLYNAVKNGKLSLEDFKMLLEEIWSDGWDVGNDYAVENERGNGSNASIFNIEYFLEKYLE